MKWIVGLFLVTALSGCFSEEARPEHCPSWVLGPDSYSPLMYWDPMDPIFYKQGRPIPMRDSFEGGTPNQLVMNFYEQPNREVNYQPHIVVVDGVLEGYAFDNATGERLNFRIGNERTDTLRYEHGLYTNFTVVLEFDHPDDPAQKRPARLDWQFFPNADGNPETPSGAELDFVSHISYRIC